MKIIGVETVRVGAFPSLVFLQVHTDEGLVGLGETCLGAQAVEAHVHEAIAPKILGLDPMRVDWVGRQLYDDFVGFGDAGVATRARSALNLALVDLVGQASGLSLSQLLGGRHRSSIRVYNSCAGPGYGSTDSNVDRSGNWPTKAGGGRYEDFEAVLFHAGELARELLDEGITAMKLWPLDRIAQLDGGRSVSAEDLRAALRPLEDIRGAVGDRMDIMIDMHGMWHLPAAVQVMRALDEFEPFWIEDPVKADDMSVLPRLADSVRSPIAMGETLATGWSFDRLLTTQAVDVVMFDIGWIGGVSEAARVAALADVRSRPVSPHDCTGPVVLTAGVHLSVSTPNTLIQETVRAFYRGWYRDLVTRLPRIERGYAEPPHGPGLGTALHPDVRTRSDAFWKQTGRTTST